MIQPPLSDAGYNEFNFSPGHLFTLFSYLKHNNPGLQVDVLDWPRAHVEEPETTAERGDLLFSNRLKKQLKKYAPDVIGISCYTSMHYIITQLVALIYKEENPDGIVIVGGFHPTFVPDDFTAPAAPYDYIIQGEGEVALSRLLKQPLRPRQRAKVVPGIPLDLETEVLMWDDYPYFDKGAKVTLFFSRGCPFECNFCVEPNRLRNPGARYRVYSSTKARRTIETLIKRLTPEGIFFGEAAFGLNPQWRRQFLKDLAEVAPGILFWGETRVDTFSKEDVDLLKPLRFRLDLGLDAIVPDNILRQNKSRNPEEYIRRFTALDDYMNEQELPHSIFILHNFPGETPRTYAQTKQRLLDIAGKRSYNYSCFGPQPYCLYPGSSAYRDMKHYEEKYGSRFPNDGWWREISDDRNALARAIVAGKEMEGKDIDFLAEAKQLMDKIIPDKKLLHWPFRWGS